MDETPARRGPYVADRYYARRSLTSRDLLPAVGAAVGVGLTAFYLAKIWMERVILDEFRPPAAVRPPAEKEAKRARIAERAERERVAPKRGAGPV